MSRRLAAAGLLVVAQLVAGPVGAAEPSSAPASVGSDDGQRLGEFLGRVAAGLAAAIDARRARPPTPVKLTFRDRKLLTLDPGAPLLAIAAGSLDGDRRAELVWLTTAEVIVLRIERDRAEVVARLPLVGRPAVPRPRDPVGALVLIDRDGDGTREIVARSSELADGVVLALAPTGLVERGRAAGFPLCRGHAELVPGRNYFARDRVVADPPVDLPAEFFAAACIEGLVDRRGGPIDATVAVDLDGRLHIACRGAAAPCAAPAAGTLDDVGDAFTLGDLDGDGEPEVAHARGGPPGQVDEVVVLGRLRGVVHRLHGRKVQGGVAGVAAADLDGDGAAEVVAAVRSPGSTEVTLWRLN